MPEKECPWCCLHVSSPGGTGSIPDLGSKILYAMWYSKKKKKENPRDHFRVLLFPETFHIHGWKNPHKGLKAEKIPSLIA